MKKSVILTTKPKFSDRNSDLVTENPSLVTENPSLVTENPSLVTEKQI